MEDYTYLKKNGLVMAEERGLFKNGITVYNLAVNLKSRYISENIIRRTWDYHKEHGSLITDGQETRLIFQNCAFAGMYCAYSPSYNEDQLLNLFETTYGINRIDIIFKNRCYYYTHPKAYKSNHNYLSPFK